ncbi:MAG: hypothetical protein AAF708_12610 [Deinococcota bacterium]
MKRPIQPAKRVGFAALAVALVVIAVLGVNYGVNWRQQRLAVQWLEHNQQRIQDLYERVLNDAKLGAIMTTLAADGVVVDLSNAFYLLNNDDRTRVIETVTVLVNGGYVLAFNFVNGDLMDATLAGVDETAEGAQEVYVINFDLELVARTQEPITGDPDTYREGAWSGDDSLANMIRISGPISDSPFYGIDFPDGYFDEGAGVSSSQQSFSGTLEIQATNQDEPMCDPEEVSEINEETIEFQMSINLDAGTANALANFALRHRDTVAVAAFAIYDSSQDCFESVDGMSIPIYNPLVADCRQPHADFASAFNLFRESLDNRLQGNQLRNSRRSAIEGRLGQEQDLIEALNQPGCKESGIANTETLTISVGDLGGISWETVTGENRTFIRNDGISGNVGDDVGYFLISSPEEFLRITNYINHEPGEGGLIGLPSLLPLPEGTTGGVALEATCPVNEGLPGPEYTSIILAAAPKVGVSALYVTVECNFPD